MEGAESAKRAVTAASPGFGSFVANFHTWSIDWAMNVLRDGNPVPGGANTSTLVFYNGGVYAQDASTKVWWLWDEARLTFMGPVPSPP